MNNQKELSRTKVDLFCNCPRCFYLDVVKGIRRPSGYPFTLNSAVDKLTKHEFDHYRAKGKPHPSFMKEYLNLVPLHHENIELWRNNRKGVRVIYNRYLFYGAIDDIWVSTKTGRWHIVDYKATAKKDPVKELDMDAAHHKVHTRQLSFYNWLLTMNGYPMDEVGFFYYSTGNNQAKTFANTLSFESHIIPFNCDTSWVEPTLDQLIECIESPIIAKSTNNCSYCQYVNNQNTYLNTLKSE